MSVKIGKRYSTYNGVEFLVRKGGEDDIMDGNLAVLPSDSSYDTEPIRTEEREYLIGKRLAILVDHGLKDEKGRPVLEQTGPEILIIKKGKADLRYQGQKLEVLEPKVLPSAD